MGFKVIHSKIPSSVFIELMCLDETLASSGRFWSFLGRSTSSLIHCWCWPRPKTIPGSPPFWNREDDILPCFTLGGNSGEIWYICWISGYTVWRNVEPAWWILVLCSAVVQKRFKKTIKLSLLTWYYPEISIFKVVILNIVVFLYVTVRSKTVLYSPKRRPYMSS